MPIDDETHALDLQRKFENLDRSPATDAFIRLFDTVGPLLNVLLKFGGRQPADLVSTIGAGLTFLKQRQQRRDQVYRDAMVDALSRKVERIERGELPLTERHIEFVKERLMPLIM